MGSSICTIHTLGRQRIQQLGIDGQQPLQQLQLVGAVLGLAQRQIGDGADEDGFGLDALCPGFGQLFQQATASSLNSVVELNSGTM
jgi:hypothetical protein